MSTKGKVLLIDDDVDFVMMNKSVLEHNGYQVCVAFGGQEGLEVARTELPDLVVLDVMMGDTIEGFDVSREFRQDQTVGHVPIIMLTSINRQLRPLTFGPDENWLPVDRFLDKPVRPQQLLEEIERIIARD